MPGWTAGLELIWTNRPQGTAPIRVAEKIGERLQGRPAFHGGGVLVCYWPQAMAGKRWKKPGFRVKGTDVPVGLPLL